MNRGATKAYERKARWDRGFTMRMVGLLADCAIYLDHKIGLIADRVFAMLPTKSQEKLRNLNASFVMHRNNYLGIQAASKESRESTASQIDTFQVSTSQKIEIKEIGLEKDSDERVKNEAIKNKKVADELELQRGDVPGWVLVVLMTTGLVTALWTIAAPRLSQILRNSLDSMNSIR